MPPTSVSIFEEGAEIVSFKIVDGGVFDRNGLVEYMVEKPSQYPGSSGCRNIRDVESDLKAVRTSNQLHDRFQHQTISSKSRRIIKGSSLSMPVRQYVVPSLSVLTKSQSSTTMDLIRSKNICTTFVPTPRNLCGIFSAMLSNELDPTFFLPSITLMMARRYVSSIELYCRNTQYLFRSNFG